MGWLQLNIEKCVDTLKKLFISLRKVIYCFLQNHQSLDKHCIQFFLNGLNNVLFLLEQHMFKYLPIYLVLFFTFISHLMAL